MSDFAAYTHKTPLFSLETTTSASASASASASSLQPARVVGIHDGDTMSCILNVNGSFARFNIRLTGIDSPEMTSRDPALKAAAIQVRDHVISLVTQKPYDSRKTPHVTRTDICEYLCKEVYMVNLHCGQFDKYGRVLAEVFVPDNSQGGQGYQSINNILIKEGLVNSYDGGHKLTTFNI